MRDLSWSELLRRFAAALKDPDGEAEANALWAEIEDQLKLAARMTDLGRYGLSEADVETQVADVLNEIRNGRFADLEHPQIDIIRRLQTAAVEFARRILRTPLLAVELGEHTEEPVDRIQSAIATLPVKDQRLLHMRFGEEKELLVIAKELGVSYAQAAARMFKILAWLRAQIHINRDSDTM